MTFEQQRDVLDKTYKQLTKFCGKPPRGSVTPWWETSKEGCDLLLSYGIEYDHSMSHEVNLDNHPSQLHMLILGRTTSVTGSEQATRGPRSTIRKRPRSG